MEMSNCKRMKLFSNTTVALNAFFCYEILPYLKISSAIYGSRQALQRPSKAVSRTVRIMNEQEKLQDLLANLKAEHRDLDDAISALSQRDTPDMIQIQRLKKRKLYIRDEIMRTESKLLPDIIA